MANYRGKHVARSRRVIILLAAAAVAVMVLTAAALISQKYWTREPQVPEPPPLEDASRSSPAGSGRADVSSGGPAAAGEPEAPPYDFSRPAPEGEAVDNGYFDDAAFVGDSRTDGFMLYSGIGTGKNLTSNGLSIFRLAEKKALTIEGEKYTLLEALALEEYGKVYISLGINELGYNNDKGFYRSYCAAIDEIRRLQPKAVIYVQGLIPVNEAQVMDSTGRDYLANDHLRVYNDLLRQAAEEKQVVYLDLYSEFADENGILPEEDSRDGVHLKKPACQRWLEYLKTHTVDFDALYPDGPPIPEPAESEPGEPAATTADRSVQE